MFYGGEIDCLLGEMSIEALNKILDLLDDFIELEEAIMEQE